MSRLGLNRSTVALLMAILLIGAGQELWAPFMPKYIQSTLEARHPSAVMLLLAVGLFGSWKDFQEAVYYLLGGRLGARLGTRRALLIFSLVPFVGYILLLSSVAPWAAFAALPFIAAYDSIAQPATLTTVAASLSSHTRTMAFSLQAIQRRIPRIMAYLAGGALVAWLGAIGGVRASLVVSAGLVLLAFVVQLVLLKHDTKDAAPHPPISLALLRRFDPRLKRLLLSDILARIAEGLPRELFILYAVTSKVSHPSFGVYGISAATFGQLLALQAFVSLLTYLPVGYFASRGSKNPFITLTFIFFASFPLAFYLLGGWGLPGLVIAYAIAGLREIGEPARKALITELLPADSRTAATGLYWSIRTFAVMLAPILGAILWLTVSPGAVFITAASIGYIGAALFFLTGKRRSEIDVQVPRRA